jgi:hypothetical protein
VGLVIGVAKMAGFVAMATTISAGAAFLCLTGHKTKAFAAVNIGYWCAAAFLTASVFYELDLVHLMEALIAVGPMVIIPGVLLLLCVSGRLSRRAVLPIAFAAVLLAFPLTIYTSLTASCHMLKTVDTCL